jgi:hypothetical protein
MSLAGTLLPLPSFSSRGIAVEERHCMRWRNDAHLRSLQQAA